MTASPSHVCFHAVARLLQVQARMSTVDMQYCAFLHFIDEFLGSKAVVCRSFSCAHARARLRIQVIACCRLQVKGLSSIQSKASHFHKTEIGQFVWTGVLPPLVYLYEFSPGYFSHALKPPFSCTPVNYCHPPPSPPMGTCPLIPFRFRLMETAPWFYKQIPSESCPASSSICQLTF
jgi:hypothetical protein